MSNNTFGKNSIIKKNNSYISLGLFSNSITNSINNTMNFLFSDYNGINYEKNLNISYITNGKPVIQDLGNREQTISIKLYVYGSSSIKLEENSYSNNFIPSIATVEKFNDNYKRRENSILNNYLKQLDFLKSLVEKQNTKVLFIDPYNNIYKCVVQKCSQISEKYNKAVFDLSLVVLQEKEANYTDSNIDFTQANKFFDNLVENISKNWLIINNVLNNTANTINQVLDGINGTKNDILSGFNNIGVLSQQIENIKDNINSIASSPKDFKSAMDNLKNSFKNAINKSSDSNNKIGEIQKRYSGSHKIKSNSITINNILTKKNLITNTEDEQNVMQLNYINLTNDYFYYQTFAETVQTMQIDNIEEKNVLRNLSNNLFDELLDNDSLNDDLESLNFKREIIKTKISLDSIIDNMSAKNIVEIEVKNKTLLNVLNEYYGNDELFYEIIKLNNYSYIDIINLNGKVKVYGN